jgi:hypothetical protein
MIERQIEAPVLPGDGDGTFRVVEEAGSASKDHAAEKVYVEPGGLVEIAISELGGEVTEVEFLPDEEP